VSFPGPAQLYIACLWYGKLGGAWEQGYFKV